MKFYGRKRRVYPKRKTATKKAHYKRRSTRVNTAVKRYVNKTIHKNIENKIVEKQALGATVTDYAFAPSLLVDSLIPYSLISQGTGQGDRIGNQIRTRKLLFKYVLTPNKYDATVNPGPIPQDVIIMFGKVKNSRPQQPISTDFAKLYQLGDSVVAPNSTLLDLVRDVNKDWFTVYKICKHKIGYQAVNYSGASLPNEGFANNDYKFNVIRTLDLTKYCPKNIKFNDTTSQPTNDGFWMWAMCVNADGTANVTNSVPALMTYVISYSYEDA